MTETAGACIEMYPSEMAWTRDKMPHDPHDREPVCSPSQLPAVSSVFNFDLTHGSITKVRDQLQNLQESAIMRAIYRAATCSTGKTRVDVLDGTIEPRTLKLGSRCFSHNTVDRESLQTATTKLHQAVLLDLQNSNKRLHS